MMEWEKPYMEACIDALKPTGDVLEVGFGLGYSANHIQSYNPKSHTIIECDPAVIEKMKEWEKTVPGPIHIVENTWQKALPTFGKFDCIFFDDYPLESTSEMDDLHAHSEEGKQLIEKEKALFKMIDQLLPMMKHIKYRDQDLDEFLNALPESEKGAIRPFLDALLNQDNITKDQYWRYSNAYGHFGWNDSPFKQTHDRLFYFLEQCLENHMNPGARFSCFIEEPKSKKDDPKFKKTVLNNPNLSYEEHFIDIEVPKHCAYYKGNRALVITITKN